MKIAIYHVNMNRDQNRMAFRSVDDEHEIDRSIYDLVYTGEVPDDVSLEDVYHIFNIEQPEDYRAHSLSVSDIVEFPEKGTAFFCQDIGWLAIAPFEKAPAQSQQEAEDKFDAEFLEKERKADLDAALEDAAASLKMSLPELKREIFYEVQKENDMANVRTWLDDNHYRYTEADAETILEQFENHFDSDYGVWDNIAASAYAVCNQLSSVLKSEISKDFNRDVEEDYK